MSGGDQPLAIQALDRPLVEEKPTSSEIKIPAGLKQPLLPLLPDAKSATGLRLVLLEDDTSGFPSGSIRFVNACEKKLAFVRDKKVVPIHPAFVGSHTNGSRWQRTQPGRSALFL